MIFLDADAWIFNPLILKNIIDNLPLTKNGIFSRDPYLKKNTYINSGSFIIRINNYTKNMYSILEKQARKNPRFKWPRDQFYISNYVFENKDDFVIYKPDIVNTPIGKVIRHSWIKDFSTCKIENNFEELNIDLFFDDNDFPNKMEEGYEYFEEKKIIEHFGDIKEKKLCNNNFLKIILLFLIIYILIIY